MKRNVAFFRRIFSRLITPEQRPPAGSVFRKKPLRLEHLERRQLLAVSPFFPADDLELTTTSADAASNTETTTASGIVNRPMTLEEYISFYDSWFDEFGNFSDSPGQPAQGEETPAASVSAPVVYGPVTLAEFLLLSAYRFGYSGNDPSMQASCGGCGGTPGDDTVPLTTILEQDGLFGNAYHSGNSSCGGCGGSNCHAYDDYLPIATGMSSFNCSACTCIEFGEDVDWTRFTIRDPGPSYSSITSDASRPNARIYQGTSPVLHVIPLNNKKPENDITINISTSVLQPTSCCCCPGTLEIPLGSYSLTILDDDRWKVGVKTSDETATERLADVTQDYGEYTFTRTLFDEDGAEHDGRTGDTNYEITIAFDMIFDSARQNEADNRAARPGSDYTLQYQNKDGQWIAMPTPTSPQVTGTVAKYRYNVAIPTGCNDVKVRLVSIFDWEDEGVLFAPTSGATPDQDIGEFAHLEIVQTEWTGITPNNIGWTPQNAVDRRVLPMLDENGEPLVDGNGNTLTAARDKARVEIKDGAILELYLDYDGDKKLDVERSVADCICYVPYNDDDDNGNTVLDYQETTIVEGEDDLRTAKLYAWVGSPGSYTFNVYQNHQTVGKKVELWLHDTKGTLLAETPQNPGRTLIGTITSSQTSVGQDFWVESVALGISPLTAQAEAFLGTTRLSALDGSESTEITTFYVDLDIDSDNNGEIERSRIEEMYEMASPGKILLYNHIYDNTGYDPNVELDTLRDTMVPIVVDAMGLDSTWTRSLMWNNSLVNVFQQQSNGKYALLSPSELTNVSNLYIEARKWNPSGTNESVITLTVSKNLISYTDHVMVTNSLFVMDHVTTNFDPAYKTYTPGQQNLMWTCDLNQGIFVTQNTGGLKYPTALGNAFPNESIPAITDNGGAYLMSANSYAEGFTMEFDYVFDRSRGNGGLGYVQGDTNDDGICGDGGDSKKFSFVANSGIKLGGIGGSTSFSEIAIFDTYAMVMEAFKLRGDLIGDDGPTDLQLGSLFTFAVNPPFEIEVNGNTVFQSEPPNKLLNGVLYGGAYSNMPEWDNSYVALLRAAIDRDKSGGGQMEIVWTPSSGGTLTVYVNNMLTYEQDGISVGDGYIYIQSHWGSGVNFSNVQITAHTNTTT